MNKCSEQVREEGMWPKYHGCSREGKHVHDGKLYCAQHYPPNVQKRREESTKRWEEKSARELKPLYRASMFTDLVSALRDLAPGKMLPEDAPCHYGLVSQDKCANCQRIKRALDLLKQAEQYE